MNLFIIFISGILAGIILVWVFGWVKSRRKKESLIERQRREKEADKTAILGIMAETQPQMTVAQADMYLSIPESTATRYFEELEQEGKVRQVGTTGQAVYYELVK